MTAPTLPAATLPGPPCYRPCALSACRCSAVSSIPSISLHIHIAIRSRPGRSLEDRQSPSPSFASRTSFAPSVFSILQGSGAGIAASAPARPCPFLRSPASPLFRGGSPRLAGQAIEGGFCSVSRPGGKQSRPRRSIVRGSCASSSRRPSRGALDVNGQGALPRNVVLPRAHARVRRVRRRVSSIKSCNISRLSPLRGT